MSKSESTPPRSNWYLSTGGSATKGLYALTIIDLQRFNNNGNTDTSLRDATSRIFAFAVNPKSMNLEEPAAAAIQPTQDGSQYVEHQGQIYKNINITGTTGMRPNRDMSGGFIPIAGIVNPFANGQIDHATGLPQGERTGFDDFIALRNLHRTYWDAKTNDAIASTTVMVWQNGKEGEYYVVEPMVFKTVRDASAPLTFTYEVSYRTLGRLDITQVANQQDSYLKRNGVETFFQRLSDVRRQLAADFQLVNNSVDRVVSLGQAAITETLSPVNDVLKALTGVITSGTRVFGIPRANLSVIATSAIELAQALDNASDAYKTYGFVDQLTQISRASKDMVRQTNAVRAETQLFSSPLSSTMSIKQKAYSNALTGAPLTGGSPTYLGNNSPTNSAAVSTVMKDENIYGAANRLLGDAAKWKMLVLLNGLKPPYLSASGDGVNVLRPGDQILFPRSSADSSTAVLPTEQKYSGVAPLEQRLGRDLALQAIQAASGVNVYDLVVGPTGDLQVIDGLDNMDQAIEVKFNTEQNTLPTHPFFGIQFPLGDKARVQSLVGFQINVRATLLSDSRIENVDDLKVSSTGNVLNLKANVTLQGADTALALDYSVRR